MNVDEWNKFCGILAIMLFVSWTIGCFAICRFAKPDDNYELIEKKK